jgi:small subunit ribosomal protein S24e
MEVKVTSNKENALLERREIKFMIDQDGATSRRDDVKRELCKMLNLSPDSTIVVSINQGFGGKECSGTAHSYKDSKALEKYERKYLLDRVSKSAKKGGAAKEEAPAEEKKE